MITKIAHIGIAVKDISTSTDLFSKLLGKSAGHSESVPEHKVHTVVFQVGETGIELIQASELDSPIAKFVERQGEGVHHLSLVVDDIGREMARLQSLGFRLIGERPRLGADGYLVAFLHPKSTNGVLIEISQKQPDASGV